MADTRDKRGKGSRAGAHDETWLLPLPVPEAIEGGDSMMEQWHRAARELDEAFAPTEPSSAVPLSVPAGREQLPPARPGPLTADALMVLARRNNRVCPRPAVWSQLYAALDGQRYVDLQPPPVERWIWGKLSPLQKRLRLREHIEWAERHRKLPQLARFLEQLSEDDWLHMDEA